MQASASLPFESSILRIFTYGSLCHFCNMLYPPDEIEVVKNLFFGSFLIELVEVFLEELAQRFLWVFYGAFEEAENDAVGFCSLCFGGATAIEGVDERVDEQNVSFFKMG